ncbi:hypothetical protein Godav_025943 [Gossypium davidsonii]|uniref:Uncharacterized protein n=2 Tax=Gossypium TaxID=3633 RepID=A0A7J8T6F3_GOSDV|nr:hypothetical protein [Gossypium davidsonii]
MTTIKSDEAAIDISAQKSDSEERKMLYKKSAVHLILVLLLSFSLLLPPSSTTNTHLTRKPPKCPPHGLGCHASHSDSALPRDHGKVGFVYVEEVFCEATLRRYTGSLAANYSDRLREPGLRVHFETRMKHLFCATPASDHRLRWRYSGGHGRMGESF